MFWKKRSYSQINLFVSIGAGFNQIPLIEEAKELGFHIIGVDINTCADGILKCDFNIQESIENYMEIYKKLRELLIDGEIHGVLSRSFGAAIKTTSFIANKLQIPLIPFNRVDDFMDKKRMKSIFKKNNIKSADYIVINKKFTFNKINNIEYPQVIKPSKGHAKNGVKLLQKPTDFEKYYNREKFDRNEDYLIEKYIEGDEIIALGIVHKSHFYLIDITDKIVTPFPYFVDLMHISPSKYYHLWNEIVDIGQKVVNAFEIVTSPLIMELKVTSNEEIVIIEAVPEFGGEFLSDILIPARTGYNFHRESIKAVTNDDFKPPLKKKLKSTVVVKFITGKKGELVSFNIKNTKEINKKNGLIYYKMLKNMGSSVSKPKSNHDRIGVIITKGKRRNETVDAAKKVEESLYIKIRD